MPNSAFLCATILKLPLGLRALATVAAHGGYGSLEVLRFFQHWIGVTSDSPQKVLLPSFYANLDPKRIPTPGRLDTMLLSTEKDFSCVDRPIACLRALCALPGIPKGALTDLWRRVWPWIEFIHTYRNFLPGYPLEKEICAYFITLLRRCKRDEATDNLISETPGVRVLLARTWVVFVEAQEFILRLPADNLFRYTYLPDPVVMSLSDVLLWESMR
ncbi:hypothetical protein B0H19DRAFT_9861 [Mycena capillaripes]|nr:hypothetical protein B0H19DRAFT_9861 [Mycena capillaripes]